MFKGVAFALTACFIWGLIFIVPEWMEGFSSIEIALGRYFVYGVISILIFLKMVLQKKGRYPRRIWLKALLFSLVCTIGYYTCVVLALRDASPAICALVLGISPITIAFYGNFRQKETSFGSLILPSVLILIGLVIINIPHFEATASPGTYLMGLLFSFLALMAWSWYVVANSEFLKKHAHVTPDDWSTMLGVATLFWVFIFVIVLSVFFENEFHMEKYTTMHDGLVTFWIGATILGLLCSWVGAYLWNQASLHLPVSLAGQLTIFETIFGIIFVYTASQSLPSILEGIGIIILLSAVLFGIRHFSKIRVKQITPH